jgi:2-C-methyl-D-erythritol 4-phosphate cytidylyltransferase/2-C-methyl-D-erythritol 2,4-cyclodiphosphate synthase
LKGLEKSDGVIPVVNIVDSLRRNSNPQSREGLVKVQTPQAFDFESVLQAHEKCKGKSFTDDACVFEENGGSVLEVQGREENFKITTREDLERAEIILNGKMEYRVGKGIDVHRFSDEKFADGGVIIGGIKIKHDKNIIAHSDGDVLIHALVDALLGSVGEGDIGDFFPPSDDEFKDMDSEIFLKKACDVLKEKNAKIVNVDLTILAERPKITPHKEMIKKNLARILEIEESRVSVKATTTEKLGFVGREEGIAAEAIVNIKII